jgi:DNA-binding IclR family transcriptional regulator
MTQEFRFGRVPPSDLLGSVQRALRVLEVVADNPDGIAAKAIARRLGVGLSTAYHVLNTLVAEGYVVHLGAAGFGLGYKIPALYRSLHTKLGVTPAVEEALREVHERARAAVYFAVYRGSDVVVAHVVDSATTPRVEPLDVGFNEAAHALAFGKVMLASLPPAAWREYVEDHELAPITSRTITGRQALEREFAQVAMAGLATDVEEFRPGLACMAAPVVNREGAVVGCVSLSVPAPTFAARRPVLEQAVRQGARRTSRALTLTI